MDNIEAVIIVLVAAVVFFVIIFAIFVLVAVRAFRRRVVPQSAIDALAEFRSDGIKILNEVPSGPPAVPDWKKKWSDWADQVADYLSKHFTRAEMLSFRRLGLIAPNQFGIAVNADHAHSLMMLAKQLTTLENLIQEHQERH